MSVESYDRPMPHLSWSAVLAGGFVGVALEGVLSFLGNALGLQLVNPLNLTAARTLETGAVLWSLAIPLACFFMGGLVAGAVSAYHGAFDGLLTGFVVWAFIGVLQVTLASWMMGGAMANLIRSPAGMTPYNGALWLMFFSAVLALLGSVAGAMAASRPSVRLPFYNREERRPLTQ